MTSFNGQFKSFFLSAGINRQGRSFFQGKRTKPYPIEGAILERAYARIVMIVHAHAKKCARAYALTFPAHTRKRLNKRKAQLRFVNGYGSASTLPTLRQIKFQTKNLQKILDKINSLSYNEENSLQRS